MQYDFDSIDELLLYIEGMCDAAKDKNLGMRQILDIIRNSNFPDIGTKEMNMKFNIVNWDDHRQGKSIDLVSAFYDSIEEPYLPEQLEKAVDYLKTIRQLHPIVSRQGRSRGYRNRSHTY